MTPSPIMPSIGRVVLVRSADWEGDAPGIVNKVHSQDCINVFVMPDQQIAHSRTSILHDDDGSGGQSISWHWMDYQKKVAEERDTATGEAK